MHIFELIKIKDKTGLEVAVGLDFAAGLKIHQVKPSTTASFK